jgi:hypothetical protein
MLECAYTSSTLSESVMLGTRAVFDDPTFLHPGYSLATGSLIPNGVHKQHVQLDMYP